jgi:hypothetical protein
VIEDLHVAGMVKNEKLARSLSDIGFGTLRRQLEYKALRYDTELIIAERWYPSSKLCHVCNWKNNGLTLQDRNWCCQQCGTHHDRDINAAMMVGVMKPLPPLLHYPVYSQAQQQYKERIQQRLRRQLQLQQE